MGEVSAVGLWVSSEAAHPPPINTSNENKATASKRFIPAILRPNENFCSLVAAAAVAGVGDFGIGYAGSPGV